MVYRKFVKFEVIWKSNVKGRPKRSTTSHLRGLMCFYVFMCLYDTEAYAPDFVSCHASPWIAVTVLLYWASTSANFSWLPGTISLPLSSSVSSSLGL